MTAADAAAGYSAAEQAAPVSEAYADLIVLAGGRAMRLVGSTWIDTAYDPTMPTAEVAFGSEDYFRLAATDPSLAAALGVGREVVVVFDGTAYQIVGSDVATEPLPELISPGAGDQPTGETQRATVALLSALAAVAGIALTMARR